MCFLGRLVVRLGGGPRDSVCRRERERLTLLAPLLAGVALLLRTGAGLKEVALSHSEASQLSS